MENKKKNCQEDRKLLLEVRRLMDEHGGIVKTSQLYDLHMDYRKIQQFVKQGWIQRVKSGYYGVDFKNRSEENLITTLFPDGVLCMESALYYYGYMKQKPHRWHIAVDKNTSKSRFKLDYPQVQPYYAEPEVIELGQTQVLLGDGIMRIYDKERLMCDCLKYDSKLDHEVLKGALRSYIEEPIKDIQRLMEYAYARKVVQKVQNTIGIWL